LNVIQVRIDDNVRMLAKLHARWEREDEMARNIKVCTITTTSDVVSNASKPPSSNGRMNGVEKKSLLLMRNCLKLLEFFLIKVLKKIGVW
jgi:hypothetical protein